MFAGKSKCLDPDQLLTVIIDGVHNEVNWERGNVPFLSYVVFSMVMILVASIITAAASRSPVESVLFGSVIAGFLFGCGIAFEVQRMGSRCIAHDGKIGLQGKSRFCSPCQRILRPEMAKSICRLYVKCKWLEQSHAKLGPVTLDKEVLRELDWLMSQVSKL